MESPLKAMVLHHVSDIETKPLLLEEDSPVPEPKENEVLVQVDKCGVCRTDLHIIEGDLTPPSKAIIPGHEIVGKIVRVGTNVEYLSKGEVVGVPWLHSTCGRCEFCITSRENLCENKTFTGYTVNGGYCQYVVGRESYVFPIQSNADPARTAPFLCAGIIGYRALKVALPRPGGRIGFFGFGGSAHLTLQLASKFGYETVAYSRNPSHLALARELGASATVQVKGNGPIDSNHGGSLDSAVVFAPTGYVVLQALSVLKKGGFLSIAAIHMSPVPEIEYDKYLFGERKIMSVESNTRSDAQEFLDLAQRLKLESTVTVRPLEEANEALLDLKQGKVVGAFVLDCRNS